MVRLLIAIVVSAALGAGMGVAFYSREFSKLERFGPFGDGETVTAADVSQYLNSKKPKQGTPIAEVVGDKQHDFGTMFRKQKGEHEFVIRNGGDQPLDLVVMSSTCKCTIGSLEKSTLNPGEQTKIKLIWEVKTDASYFTQSATIGTSDPLRREIALIVSGNVVDDLIWSPGHWNIGSIAPNEEKDMKSTAYVFTDEPVYIREAGWTRPQIGDFSEFRFEERDINSEDEARYRKARKAIDLHVKIKPGLRQGPLSETFRVLFSVGSKDIPLVECKPAEFSLGGKVVGNVSMIGGVQLSNNEEMYIYEFGEIVKGKGATAKAFLVVRGEETKDVVPRIEEVNPSEVLVAKLGEPTVREKSTLFPIEVTIPADAPVIERSGRDRNDYGYVLIKFNRDDWAPFKLFVGFRVVEGGRTGETR